MVWAVLVHRTSAVHLNVCGHNSKTGDAIKLQFLEADFVCVWTE